MYLFPAVCKVTDAEERLDIKISRTVQSSGYIWQNMCEYVIAFPDRSISARLGLPASVCPA